MNVGTTTVENLLRVARSEAAAGTAFVALAGDGSPPQIVTVPTLAPGPESLSSDDLAELVRQAAADPEFREARAFVRSVQMGRPRTLVVAPLGDGSGHSMIGIVAEPDRQFGPEQLEVLERLAERLLRHLHVVRQLESAAVQEEELRARADDQPDASRPATFDVAEGLAGGGPAADEAGTSASAPEQSLEHPGVAPDAPPATWWGEPDPVAGCSSLGQFFSRFGRMLAPDDRTAGALGLIVVELDPRTVTNAARALRAQLRFSDPMTRIAHDLLAVAMLLLPAGTGDVVEQRLAAAVRSALERPTTVRTARVLAEPGGRRDVDELLREAISRLPGRDAGGGGAPWRGAGGSAARLPIP